MIPEFETTITSIETVARDTKIFRFTKPAGWNFVAGQFISLKFTDRAFRAYSIASAPSQDFIELVVRLVAGGLGSEVLRVARVGQKFSFRGAFGMLKLSKTEKAPQVFCATGTGIAPFRSMILTELESADPRPMTVLYGGKDAEDLAYLSELSKNNAVNCFFGLSREVSDEKISNLTNGSTQVKKCRITEFLCEENFGDMAEYYICGSGVMVNSVRECLEKKGVLTEKIHQERFN